MVFQWVLTLLLQSNSVFRWFFHLRKKTYVHTYIHKKIHTWSLPATYIVCVNFTHEWLTVGQFKVDSERLSFGKFFYGKNYVEKNSYFALLHLSDLGFELKTLPDITDWLNLRSDSKVMNLKKETPVDLLGRPIDLTSHETFISLLWYFSITNYIIRRQVYKYLWNYIMKENQGNRS